MKVIFSFFVDGHIFLSMKGGDVRNIHLLTKDKITISKEKKFMYEIRW